MKTQLILTTAACAVLLTACAPSAETAPPPADVQNRAAPITLTGQDDAGSFAQGQAMLQARKDLIANSGKAKNVILFIGDGMGISTLTAARIYTGQKAGGPGEDYVQAMETLPYTALVKTYNTNQQVSDSAGTATAMMTGTKTRAGVINVGPDTERKDCVAATTDRLDTLAQMAGRAGLSTGIVSTARLTHATPATVYAHTPDRNWEAPKDISQARREAGCVSIAEQLIAAPKDGHMSVALGGGMGEFKYKDVDLTADWAGDVVTNAAQLSAIPDNTDKPLLGLFSRSHMEYMRLKEGGNEEPTLTQMTQKAIDILEAKDTGYFLMVESGRIDHGHHGGKAELALEETRQFDQTIADALARIDLSETLIIVTADHSHVFTLAGYPTRGNPILGLVRGNDGAGNPDGEPVLAVDGEPYTTLGYHNGPGAVEGVRNPEGANDVVVQKALIPTGSPATATRDAYLSETHAGEDVAAFAAGPGAHLVGGVIEQNVLFHIMYDALGMDAKLDSTATDQ